MAKNSNNYENLLSYASLFETEFSIDWLQELTGYKASAILELVENGIEQHELKILKPGIYQFENAKKRETRYAQIPGKEKEKRHRQVLRILQDDIREKSGDEKKLANHLLALSDINDEESRLLIKAGDDYTEGIQEQKARSCYFKAINGLLKVDNQESDELLLHAVIGYLNFASFIGERDQTVGILEIALKKARRAKNLKMQAVLYLHLCTRNWIVSDFTTANKQFRLAWKLAHELDCLEVFRSISLLSTNYYYWQGRLNDVIRVYERYVGDIDSFPSMSLPLSSSVAIAHSYASTGKLNQGVGMLHALREHSLKKGLAQIVGLVDLSLCDILIAVRRIDEAYNILMIQDEKSVKDYKIHYKKDIVLLQSYVCYRKGNLKESLRQLTLFLNLAAESEAASVSLASFGYILRLGWEMELKKYPPVKGLHLESEIERAVKSSNQFVQGNGYRYLAMLKGLRGKSSNEVLEDLNKSDRLLNKTGHLLALARTRIEIAREHLKTGNLRKARESAKRAADVIMAQDRALFPNDLGFLINQLHNKEDLLEQMIQLSQEMMTLSQKRDLVKHIMLTIIQITGAERGAIFQLTGNTSKPVFTIKAAKNLTAEEIDLPSFRKQIEMIREAAESGKLIIKKLKDARNSFKEVRGTLSCICVPMMIRNKTLGVLYCDNRLFSSAFKKENIRIFTFFAAQVAIAIDNLDTYEEVTRLNEKLREEKRYYEELQSKTLHSDNFIGKSPVMLHMMENVKKVAHTDTTVLITGETGVGKELVATAIFNHSSRVDKSFIRVNCSAFSESLIASELFGYEKGAFTGAHENRAGRFELADGGTLFLDEIGDIPMEVQIRLLRVLQSKEFERVGSSRTLHSEFRLIAATHQNLSRLVKENRFREDLFYRLNVFPLHVPALRDRKEDIPLLVRHFLSRFEKKARKQQMRIGKAEMRELCEYDWPGNIRELEHVIERGVIMSTGSVFKLPELTSRQTIENPAVSSPELTLLENEKQYVLSVLNRTKWKISGPGGCAEILNIHPNTLASRMKKLGISRKKAGP